MNLRHKVRHRIAQGFLLLALWLGAHTASALIIVNLDVTPSGGNYHYEASIFNGEAVDLALVSLFNAPLVDPLIDPSLTSPVGFLASYDSGLGIIDFLSNTSDFLVGTTTSGFSFDSASAPAGFFTSVEALSVNGASYSGQINVNLRSVPDGGGTLLTLALSLGALAIGRKRLSAHNP